MWMKKLLVGSGEGGVRWVVGEESFGKSLFGKHSIYTPRQRNDETVCPDRKQGNAASGPATRKAR